MNDKTKDLILKTLMVIDLALAIMVFPGCIVLVLIIPNIEKATIVFNCVLFSFFGVGFLFMILWLIFGGIKRPQIKADIIPLSFSNYSDFSLFLQSALTKKNYQARKTMPVIPNGEITLYIRPNGLRLLECVAVIRVPELTNDLIENAQNCITEILCSYYQKDTVTASVNMITVICVDRITYDFQKLVNGNMQQGFKNGRLCVGISFGGKKMYIANQIDGFAIAKYNQIRKEFMDIINPNS